MATITEDPDRLVLPAELAEEIVVPERTLAQWRYLGKGPAFIKVGKHVRYRRSDVEAWLDSQTRGGTG